MYKKVAVALALSIPVPCKPESLLSTTLSSIGSAIHWHSPTTLLTATGIIATYSFIRYQNRVITHYKKEVENEKLLRNALEAQLKSCVTKEELNNWQRENTQNNLTALSAHVSTTLAEHKTSLGQFVALLPKLEHIHTHIETEVARQLTPLVAENKRLSAENKILREEISTKISSLSDNIDTRAKNHEEFHAWARENIITQQKALLALTKNSEYKRQDSPRPTVSLSEERNSILQAIQNEKNHALETLTKTTEKEVLTSQQKISKHMQSLVELVRNNLDYLIHKPLTPKDIEPVLDYLMDKTDDHLEDKFTLLHTKIKITNDKVKMLVPQENSASKSPRQTLAE